MWFIDVELFSYVGVLNVNLIKIIFFVLFYFFFVMFDVKDIFFFFGSNFVFFGT